MLDEESIEPDNFVVDLNKDLATSEEALTPFLPKNKLR